MEDNKATTSARGRSMSEACATANVCSKSRKSTIKYYPSYLSFGFSWCGTEGEPRPQCVVCCDVPSNERMKPAHLKRHLTTKHAVIKDKPIALFQRKLDELKQSKAMIMSCIIPVSKAQEVSYRASLRIAKAGKPHTVRLERSCVYR